MGDYRTDPDHDRSHLYRVHLVSEESGFSNTHSPDYEIRAVADLTPELLITQPGNNHEIRSDATLEVKGIARDDVSLEVVKQAYRLNRSDWREVVLHTDCGTEQLIEHRWSLRGIGAEPGDLLVLKLVGIDSKGSVGESTPVRLAVTGWDEDPSRREWAEREKAVAEELRKLAKQTREMAHEVERAKEALKKQPEDRSLEEQQAVARAQNEAEEAQAEAEQAFAKLKQALLEAPSRAEAEELQAAAEMLADFRTRTLRGARTCRGDGGRGAAGAGGWQSAATAPRLGSGEPRRGLGESNGEARRGGQCDDRGGRHLSPRRAAGGDRAGRP